ncbi:MAG: WD40 repeat domain-containing protein [Myxococcales bacterium]|nr:WD40 repeat domain-containing protein [Myxococcales bacterium]
MDPTLVDRYCPGAHSAPVTAAVYDAQSGAVVTADEWGTVAITRPGERFPGIVFDMGSPVRGAVAIVTGGSLVAVGDDAGTVAVCNTWDGACVFEDVREGAVGEARAMRALAFNPTGTVLAALSVDGIIRIFDIQRWDRVANYQGFSGESLFFDATGERLLAMDTLGQPKLLDLLSHEQIDLEMVPGGVRSALFTPDFRKVITMGQGGISILELPSGRIENTFTARGSSGMHAIVIHPDGLELGAVTGRSVHRFALPGLEAVGSDKHGAANPTGASYWDDRGVVVGGSDGMLHRPNTKQSLEPIICVSGFGEHRVAAHGNRLAVWEKNHQKRPFKSPKRFIEVKIDRDGRLVAGLPDDNTGVCLFEARTGRFLFDAGIETANTPKMEVGGAIFASMFGRGRGIRWYDLRANNTFELPWAQTFALSGSGTWLAVVTPQGTIRVLDPTNGQDVMPPPEPLADCPVTLMSFVNRAPNLIVLDEEGVLSVYDLTESVKQSIPALGSDVLELNVQVDRLWGITGGRHAALRFQEPEDGTATIIFVDLARGEVFSEVTGLLPYAWVDPETGNIVQPARGRAILDMDMMGREDRVLRALPEGEWVAFNATGVLDRSEGFEE